MWTGAEQGWGSEGTGVIVTGAAQGIGEATARAFADVGARVCAVDLKAEALDGVVASLPGDGHRAVMIDLNDLSGHGRLVEDAMSSAERPRGGRPRGRGASPRAARRREPRRPGTGRSTRT